MNKLTRLSTSCFLFVLLISAPLSALAGETPSARSHPPRAIAPPPQESPPFSITLSTLGIKDTLVGPYDSQTVAFSLPPEMRLLPGAQIEIDLSGFFSYFVPAQEGSIDTASVAGTFSLRFNGQALPPAVLRGSGDYSLVFEIPEQALGKTDLHQLTLEWDGTASCDFNLSTIVVLGPASQIILPYEIQPLIPDLRLFPWPLIDPHSVQPAHTTLVIPNQPSSAELEAALKIAAGFGRLGATNRSFSVISAGSLPASQRAADHLILVGREESLDLIEQLPRRAAPGSAGGQVEMFVSPWNSTRLVLLVSGADEQSILEASQVVGSGKLLVGSQAHIALLEEAPPPAPPIIAEDLTLADLGAGNLVFTHFGSASRSFPFSAPAGLPSSVDSYLNLVIGHSQLIDFLRSGIVIRINGQPLGSIRLSEASAERNAVRLLIPPTSLVPGQNLLEIQVDLAPRNTCADPRWESLWVTIFEDSLIHLPQGNLSLPRQPDLAGYQTPLIAAADLSQIQILLQPGDPGGWQTAGALALHLGAAAPRALGGPGVILGAPPEAPLGSLIAITSANPVNFLEGLNAVLEADLFAPVFEPARLASGIRYTLDPAASLGYLEISSSPTLSVLVVVGTDAAGLDDAAAVLLAVDSRLIGANIALIQGSNVVADLAKPAQLLSGGPATPEPGASGPPPSAARPARPGWLLPVLIIVVLGMVAFVGLEVYALLGRRAG